MKKAIPHRTVGRLTLYRRILRDVGAPDTTHIYSHDLANRAAVTAAQVRRDLMLIGYTGSPARGYHIPRLREHIESFLFSPTEQRVAIAGMGNIGRALMKFFTARRPTIRVVASFDTNPEKYGRLFGGCPCYSIADAKAVIREMGITIGVIAVPIEQAQYVADIFAAAGIGGILNFARGPLKVPPGVYVEDIDLAMSMDKVAFFARQPGRERPEPSQQKENGA